MTVLALVYVKHAKTWQLQWDKEFAKLTVIRINWPQKTMVISLWNNTMQRSHGQKNLEVIKYCTRVQ